MKIPSLLALCSFLCVIPAWSQSQPTSNDVPSAAKTTSEFFGGISVGGGGVPQGGGASGADYGFNGGLDFRLFSRVSLVTDVSQFFHPSAGENTSDTAFLFGPRYLMALRPNSRMSVYGEFLAGGDTFHNTGQAYTFAYNTATNFAVAVKGGLDYAWTRHTSVRLEGGYLHTTLDYSTYGGTPNPATVSNNRGVFAADWVYRF